MSLFSSLLGDRIELGEGRARFVGYCNAKQPAETLEAGDPPASGLLAAALRLLLVWILALQHFVKKILHLPQLDAERQVLQRAGASRKCFEGG